MGNYTRNIKSIPYLGKENNIIKEYMLNKCIESEIYINLYDFLNSENIHSKLVIVDNKWLTWLDDIVFNYRDKKCYIHYWKYDIMPLDENLVKRDSFQYLIEKNGTFYLRYNYEYCKIDLNIGSELVIYDLHIDSKYKVIIKDWLSEKVFNIEKLYKLYIESCFYDDIITKDREYGRYYIDKFSKKLSNRELKLRRDLLIDTFKDNNSLVHERDFRDVRNYKIEEIWSKYGMIDTIDSYKNRRLKFDSYLYCILRADIPSNDSYFNDEISKLKKGKHVIKYGENIKLLFKDYWFNNIEIKKYQTWMRLDGIYKN